MHKGNVLDSQKGLNKASPQISIEDARVMVSGYFYAVHFGYHADSRQHRVGKDRRCSCPLGVTCPAVLAVVDYLKAGGARAPDPPPGYFPLAPAVCPVCGAEVYYRADLSSKHRGAGWACVSGGVSHYWQAHTKTLQEQLKKNPWVFRPVIATDGKVLYPGLRRDEVITEDSISRE
ncbi:MAG: hypothetical protein JNM55_20990 [Anaerolineales bacterium]|nr:hypothetical protein [Anaerolineales bacterium]